MGIKKERKRPSISKNAETIPIATKDTDDYKIVVNKIIERNADKKIFRLALGTEFKLKKITGPDRILLEHTISNEIQSKISDWITLSSDMFKKEKMIDGRVKEVFPLLIEMADTQLEKKRSMKKLFQELWDE